MLKGSSFYRDNPKLVCMGHPQRGRPCSYEPESRVLSAARAAVKRRKLTQEDLRCIELDIQGYPGKMIIGFHGPDPTGAYAKRAKYTCEKAYAKIGRRLCLVCQMLWAADKPKGPRLDADLNLKIPREEWAGMKKVPVDGPVRIKRGKKFSVADFD